MSGKPLEQQWHTVAHIGAGAIVPIIENTSDSHFNPMRAVYLMEKSRSLEDLDHWDRRVERIDFPTDNQQLIDGLLQFFSCQSFDLDKTNFNLIHNHGIVSLELIQKLEETEYNNFQLLLAEKLEPSVCQTYQRRVQLARINGQSAFWTSPESGGLACRRVVEATYAKSKKFLEAVDFASLHPHLHHELAHGALDQKYPCLLTLWQHSEQIGEALLSRTDVDEQQSEKDKHAMLRVVRNFSILSELDAMIGDLVRALEPVFGDASEHRSRLNQQRLYLYYFQIGQSLDELASVLPTSHKSRWRWRLEQCLLKEPKLNEHLFARLILLFGSQVLEPDPNSLNVIDLEPLIRLPLGIRSRLLQSRKLVQLAKRIKRKEIELSEADPEIFFEQVAKFATDYRDYFDQKLAVLEQEAKMFIELFEGGQRSVVSDLN